MRAKQIIRRIRKRMLSWFCPISPRQLRQTLDSLFTDPIEILFVHSSLSSCGRFLAGPNDILDALHERTSNLGVPTHSYCYPSSEMPEGPVFDATSTPSSNGRLTEIFRAQPTVIRSIHATHSLAFCGPMANGICESHWHCTTPCGGETPYARMVQNKASVLLFGVSFHSYTLFHTAEDQAESPFAYEDRTTDYLRFLDESGTLRVQPSRRQTRDPRRFAEAGEHLVSIGLAMKARLGRSYLYFVPDCSSAHQYLVSKLRDTPDYLFRSCKTEL